jgi:hypothetical protein
MSEAIATTYRSSASQLMVGKKYCQWSWNLPRALITYQLDIQPRGWRDEIIPPLAVRDHELCFGLFKAMILDGY